MLCALLAALAFWVVGYNITNSAETKAEYTLERTRQALILARLEGVSPESRRNAEGDYRPGEEAGKQLRELLDQGQFAYLILLDGSGKVIAQSYADFPAGERFARPAPALAEARPGRSRVEIGGAYYLNTVLELPGGSGWRVAYGLSEADRNGAGLARGALWAGTAAIGLLLMFILLYFVRPLRRLLQAAEPACGLASGATDGAAGEELGLAGRRDEIGELGRLLHGLREKVRELEERPLQAAPDVIAAAIRLLEDCETGVLLLEPEGTVLLCNAAARRILRHENIPARAHIMPLLEAIMRPEERLEFRRRLGRLPLADPEPLELCLEEDSGPRHYAVSLALHEVLGERCVLCLIADQSSAYRLRQMEGSAQAQLDLAIRERTEELMKVNEQLRQENAERRAIEQALVRAESRYREIVNNSIEGIFQRTADGRLLSANASLARILGYASVEELLDAYQKPGRPIAFTGEMEFAIVELLDIRGWVSNLEFQAVMQDGNPVWVAMNARRVADSAGETLYYEAFIEDITSRKKTEEKLVYQAFHDPLTGLPNRALFLDRLRMALRMAKRRDDYLFAVLYLDLDRFKNINDSFGHSAGDKMLNHATEKLLQCVRDADTVARFGGDEFAVLLADLEKPAQAVLIARRIADALNETVNFCGQDVSIGASIGIVLSSSEYTTPEEILRDADTAMYRTKMRGRRSYTVFNDRMREETIAALALENDLRGAVERGEIEAFYQPLVDLESGRVSGFEALMRWRRENDVVGPAAFIPIAEEVGLIYGLGLEMLRLVCRQIVEWTVALGHCDFSVHVNISSKQLMATHFWRDVQEVLLTSGVNPRQLIFEITESVFLDYGSQVSSIMNTVRDFGIRFCLDDFGTGFSSLSYLRLLPLESLKVDRSFIVDLNTDNYSEAILRNLIAMGRDLGLKVITEGVDQASQVEVLRTVGCRYAQGFFFAEPLPAPEAVEYMKTRGVAGAE